MANEYATLEQAKARLMNKTTAPEDAELIGIVEAASRAIDDYLEVDQGYFSPHGGTPSVKIIRGNGQSSLPLPAPLSGTVTITADADITVPDFQVEGLTLYTVDANGLPTPFLVWPPVFFSIQGIWGYSQVPAQIREACLQLVVHFWRGRDKGLTGTITDMRQDEQFPERDFPRMTRRLLDNFKFNLAQKSQGGFFLA